MIPERKDDQPMSEHVPLPIPGYTNQSNANVDLVKANKALEEQALRMMDVLAAIQNVDKRWLAIGRTHIETGFMAVNRAVFRPKRVSLPGDPA
jgi:hypothetical protein